MSAAINMEVNGKMKSSKLKANYLSSYKTNAIKKRHGKVKKKLKYSVLFLSILSASGFSFAEDLTSTVLIDDGSNKNFSENTSIITSDIGIKLSGNMGSVTTTNNAVLTIEGEYGITAVHGNPQQTGNATVTLGETHIKSQNMGVYVSTASNDTYKTTISLGNNSTVESQKSALGISRNGHVNIGNNVSLSGKTSGATTAAVFAGYGATIDIKDDVKIFNTYIADNSIAVLAMGTLNSTSPNSHISIGDRATISALSTLSWGHAVRAGYVNNGQTQKVSGSIDIGDNAVISTKGLSSSALYSLYDESNITVGNEAHIITTGDKSIAVRSGGLSTPFTNLNGVNGGLISMGDGATIETSNNNAYGLSAQFDGSQIKIGRNANITTAGIDSHAVYAQDKGFISVGSGATITTADGTGYGVRADEGGRVELKGASIKSNNYAVYSGNDASIIGEGVFNILGNIYANVDGLVDLSFDDNSYFKGHVQLASDISSIVKFDMKNTAWNMTGSSKLSSLNMQDSQIHFAETNGTGERVYTDLTIGQLSGSGTFVMRTDIVGDGAGINSGDKLYITGTSAGDHILQILNNGSAQTDGTEVLTMVYTQDGVAQFTMNNKVELGGYLYDVRQNGNNWELYGALKPDPGPDPDPEPGPGPTDPDISTTADAGANFLNVGYLMNYAETQTLLQRMGDLRQYNEHGDFWLRGYAGKFDSFAGGKLSRFDMSYSGMQMGFDKRVSTELPLFIGLFMGQTTGSPDYRGGKGSTKSSHAGFYGAYMADSGFYLDAWVKYSQLKNSFNVKDSQNDTVNGNGKSSGLGLSLEMGQKFSLNGAAKNFYIEPQMQFAYTHQDAVSIGASNGLRVNLDSYQSVTGRASTLFGYDLFSGNNRVNVYLKTGIVREFDGDVDYRLNGSKEQHSFKGNWWNNGIGISAKLNQQHVLYIDLESSTGNKFDQRQINGGYRYSF